MAHSGEYMRSLWTYSPIISPFIYSSNSTNSQRSSSGQKRPMGGEDQVERLWIGPIDEAEHTRRHCYHPARRPWQLSEGDAGGLAEGGGRTS